MYNPHQSDKQIQTTLLLLLRIFKLHSVLDLTATQICTQAPGIQLAFCAKKSQNGERNIVIVMRQC